MSFMDEMTSICEDPSMPPAKRAKLTEGDSPSSAYAEQPPMSLDDLPDDVLRHIFSAGRRILEKGKTGLSLRRVSTRFNALYDSSRPCMRDLRIVVSPGILPCKLGKIAMGNSDRPSATREYLTRVRKMMLMVGMVVFPASELIKDYWRVEWVIRMGFAERSHHLQGVKIALNGTYQLSGILRPLREFAKSRPLLVNDTIDLDLAVGDCETAHLQGTYVDLCTLLAPYVRALTVVSYANGGHRRVPVHFPRLECAHIDVNHDCPIYPSASSPPSELTLRASSSTFTRWARDIPASVLRLQVLTSEETCGRSILNELICYSTPTTIVRIPRLDLTQARCSLGSWAAFWDEMRESHFARSRVEFDTLEIWIDHYFMLHPGLSAPSSCRTLHLRAETPRNLERLLTDKMQRAFPPPHLSSVAWESPLQAKEVIIEFWLLRCFLEEPEEVARVDQMLQERVSRAAFEKAHPGAPVPSFRIVCNKQPEEAERLNRLLFGNS